VPEPRLLTPRKLARQSRPPDHPLVICFTQAEWDRLEPLRQRGVRIGPWTRRLVREELDRLEGEKP